MAAKRKSEYQPDYVSPPGDTLAEVLNSRCMSQAQLAERTGRTPKLINEIIKGKAPITPETAIQLERALSIPSSFWNNRQRRYDEYLAHQQEIKKLNRKLHWARLFPYRAMAKLGWVPESNDSLEQIKNLLNFFGVASPESWDGYWNSIKVAYRKSLSRESDFFALAAWLRRGEQIALDVPCHRFDERKFFSCLSDIRPLTKTDPSHFQNRIVTMCAACGVIVAFVPELPKTASGATRWLTPERALLQLSLKYKTDDHLWFTFFHEAAHILYHRKRGIFIEGSEYDNEEEVQANRFAEEFLIPPREMENFISRRPPTTASIKDFADRIGIAPGIVVGQLQKKRILPWNHCNDLKRKLRWRITMAEK